MNLTSIAKVVSKNKELYQTEKLLFAQQKKLPTKQKGNHPTEGQKIPENSSDKGLIPKMWTGQCFIANYNSSIGFIRHKTHKNYWSFKL